VEINGMKIGICCPNRQNAANAQDKGEKPQIQPNFA
jgi:uncharacterized protein (DUF1499 family)